MSNHDSTQSVKKNVFKLNPFYIVVLGLDVFYETVLNTKFSLETNISYIPSARNQPKDSYVYTSINCRQGLKYFLFHQHKKQAPFGFYVGPSVAYEYFRDDYKNISTTYHAIKTSMLVGYQWRLDKYWTLDIYSGAIFYTPSVYHVDARGKTNKFSQSLALSVSFGIHL